MPLPRWVSPLQSGGAQPCSPPYTSSVQQAPQAAQSCCCKQNLRRMPVLGFGGSKCNGAYHQRPEPRVLPLRRRTAISGSRKPPIKLCTEVSLRHFVIKAPRYLTPLQLPPQGPLQGVPRGAASPLNLSQRWCNCFLAPICRLQVLDNAVIKY